MTVTTATATRHFDLGKHSRAGTQSRVTSPTGTPRRPCSTSAVAPDPCGRSIFVAPGGAFCLIWPPPKPAVVSGHVHVFNMGLMLYNLVRLGVDCRCVELVRCGYCLAIMGTYRRFRVPDLTHNEGDLDALGAFFPFRGYQGFDGDNPPGLVTLDEATER